MSFHSFYWCVLACHLLPFLMWFSGTCFSWCRHLSGPMICLWMTTGAESKLNTAGSDPLFTNGCRSEFSYKTHICECCETPREQFEFSKEKTGKWNGLCPQCTCATVHTHLVSESEVFSVLKSQILSLGTVSGQLHRCLTTLGKQSTMGQECLVFPGSNC